jgi:thioredoxin 1
VKIIKFEKDNCRYCDMVAAYLDEKNIPYQPINVMDEDPEIMVKYDIMSVPVTILLDDDGNIIERSIGYKPNELDKIVLLYNQK